MNDPGRFVTVDEVALEIVREDSSLLLVDLRPVDQFLDAHIPGAINIPLAEILNPDYEGYLDEPGRTPVLYSNGYTMAAEAWMLITQSGYNSTRIMQGGLNEWHRLVMESKFEGDRISAAENAVFEVRSRARNFYRQMNSLPDSLKTAFLEVKRKKEAELVGGCE
jgi:rhodanese-related sulfurtransferase